MAERVIGVIGGSGLYDLPGLEDVEEHEVATPFGNPSDLLLSGRLAGAPEVRLVFLARHHRTHRLLPHEINYRANVCAMKSMGAEWLISLSAVGSMREEIRPGDLVVVDQFIDRTRRREASFFGDGLAAHVAFADPVSPVLAEVLLGAARDAVEAAGGGEKVHRGGTYLVIDGPQFSTRAESKLYRSWGIDVIGMTAMPEAKLAREAEISYATLALATDYDCWHESEAAVSADAVVAIMRKNARLAQDAVLRAARAVPAERVCPAATALAGAIMTQREFIDEDVATRLDLLVGKYLSS